MRSFTELRHDERKNIIRDYLSGKSIDTICMEHDLTFDAVYSSIYYHRKNQYVVEDVIQKQIDDNRIIVMSDTFIGGKNANYNYIDEIYNYAVKNNISKVLHAGNLFDKSFKDIMHTEAKVEEFVERYPKDENIQNYVIFGGGDLATFKQNKNAYKIVKTREDFNYLGVKKAYLKWQKYIIGLKHDIDDYKVLFPYKIEEIDFSGNECKFEHVEATSERPEKVYIPACKTIRDNVYPDYLPGFLDCKLEGNEMTIDCHHFNEPEVYKSLIKVCSENKNLTRK